MNISNYLSDVKFGLNVKICRVINFNSIIYKNGFLRFKLTRAQIKVKLLVSKNIFCKI